MKRKMMMLMTALLLLISTQSFAMSPYEMDTRFIERVQQAVPYVRWNREISNDGTFITITERAKVAGSEYEFTMIGYPNRVYQACLTAPFDQLYMDDARLTDGLSIYNIVYYLVIGDIPYNNTPLAVFSAYDIETVVKKGYIFSIDHLLPDGWKWIKNEPGYVWIQRRVYPENDNVSIHLLDTGDIWFNCTY